MQTINSKKAGDKGGKPRRYIVHAFSELLKEHPV